MQRSRQAGQACQSPAHSRQLIGSQLFDSALTGSVLSALPAPDASLLAADAAPAQPLASAPKADAPKPPAMLRLANKISRAELRQILREQNVENKKVENKKQAQNFGGDWGRSFLVAGILGLALISAIIAAAIVGYNLFGLLGMFGGILCVFLPIWFFGSVVCDSPEEAIKKKQPPLF